ncbi:rho GTPase-activating protein 20-like [Manis pentadactyla]|uniref:rho GTPase-activating protein 20-like n=1 Tax=Manis pentadactyla TaxID=143292 RepID=UPI00255CC62A|nr:rho GTPase-activating protein 20-like [Manis pentadactyla]
MMLTQRHSILSPEAQENGSTPQYGAHAHGHEHPYGIKTSLLPAMFVPQELQDSIFSFILKPRHLARNQQRDSGWKRVKKSVVAHLACWKSSSASQDNPSPAPPPAKPRQLFGISMMDICDDDKLLNPILDMLAFINEKGPLTKGVFRPETNRKSCRALKKKLKSGKKVNWDGESVLVAAAVLKDFLQTIEGSLFSSSLYDKWLAIPDQGESEDDKITATRRLLDQLPRANAVLLRCLFGVLRNIEQHSKYNKMTAFGLSMYIAPSLLYLPGTCNTDLGNNMKKKISLVEFLIENCHKIFGEDATSLLGKSSVNGGTSEATGFQCSLTQAGKKQRH